MERPKRKEKGQKQLDSLVSAVQIFSLATETRFGINKCEILIMKKSRCERREGIKLPVEWKTKEIDVEYGYKYLGILKAYRVKDQPMKEYTRQVGNVLD